MNDATFDPDLDASFDPDAGPDVDKGSEAVITRPVIQTYPVVVPAESNPPDHTPITAAQAKVDAVAALTATAYARAATLEITKEESDALSADFPDEAFQPGAAGKENLIYIEHAFLRDRFAQVFGMGKWAIVPRNRWAEPFKTFKGVEGSRVYVEAMLIVRGCFVGESVGAMEYYPSNAAQNYGDAVEGAKTAAFRRCSKEFGVGLQAWKKDWCAGWWERKNAGNRQRAGHPPPPAPPAPAPAPEAEPPPAAPKAKAKKAPLTMATAGTRAAALDRLGCQEDGVAKNHLHSYLVALGWLENDKSVEQWPIRSVPINAGELENVKACLSKYSVTGIAERPYMPHGLDPKTLQAHPVAPPAAAPAPEPGWTKFVLPFGKMVALGKLTPAELALYVVNFEVKETYDVNGVTHQHTAETLASHKALRAALDQVEQPKG